MSGDGGVPDGLASRWETLLDEAEAVASEYREDGWDALLVHTGDVTALTTDPFGLDVLAPGDEFEALEERVAGSVFDRSHVYSAEEGDSLFLVIVAEASEAELAVVIPAFLTHQDVLELEGVAVERGEMQTHVRPLSDDARVTFTHDDPALFFE